jgi:RimJ/RimL family protein N-acetyltransferase
MTTELTTERLLLRQWHDDDLQAWAAMNADPEVREFFPSVLEQQEAAAALASFRDDLDERGWGWWALEERATGALIGMAGLDPVDEGMPLRPSRVAVGPSDGLLWGVGAGWRLARRAWRKGYATEAARAVFGYGFEQLRLPEILAMAAAGNVRSQAVMRRLGMTHDPADDFDDPTVPPGPLRRTVLYRLRNPHLAA